jgi:ABC-2 type transport system permease protein
VNALPEFGVVYQAETRRALRHPKSLALLLLFTVFTLLALALSSVVTTSITTAQDSIGQGSPLTPEDREQTAQAIKAPVIWTLYGQGPGILSELQAIPTMVLVVFKTVLSFLPLYAALFGFDHLSGELSSRSLRYAVVRSRRGSLLMGKLVSQLTVLGILITFLVVVLFAVGAARNPEWARPHVATHAARFALAGLLHVTVFIALTGLLSVALSQQAVCLIVNLAIITAFWVLNFVGAFADARPGTDEGPRSMWSMLRPLSPFKHLEGLFDTPGTAFAGAIAAHLAFAAVFSGAAWLLLRRREL